MNNEGAGSSSGHEEINLLSTVGGRTISATPGGLVSVVLPSCQDMSCIFLAGSPDDLVELMGPTAAGFAASSTSLLRSAPPLPPAPVASYQAATSPSTYSRSAAVAYAQKWALGANPDFELFFQDCTNFVSQALHAGGWSMITPDAACDNLDDMGVWWYRRDACWHLLSRNVHCSRTWSIARFFTLFLTNSGRATLVKKLMDLEPGDVITMDYGDDFIKHSMMVTGKSSDDLFLSYHSDNHLDEPLLARHGIVDRNRGANFYGFHIR